MNRVETTGRTVEEAVQKALSSLGIRENNAVVEVLNEPSQGLLSFIGGKGARVAVEARYSPAQYLEQFLRGLMEKMRVEGCVTVEEDDEKISAQISGKKTGILIGRRGKTLNELQHLSGTVLRRQYQGMRKMIIVDVEDYRVRREHTLTQLARSIARKVCRTGREETLEPMTPQERRIIHLALQGDDTVVTYSKGEEPYRKVVIAPR